MNKRWRNVGLYVLAVITVIFIGTSVFDKRKKILVLLLDSLRLGLFYGFFTESLKLL